VEAALRDAVATVQAELDAKQIEVEFVSRVKKAGVRADAGRLQQVFWNVLANAAKFSRPGGKVRLEIRADEEAKRFVVTCQDSGIGMTEGELARAFVPFSQGEHADGGRMHRFGGLGLGLARSPAGRHIHDRTALRK
jgi:signal transduction histidine kinase